jgi:transcriptional regulator with XRE-family HTH domain
MTSEGEATPDHEEAGQLLIRLMARKGLSVPELAERLGAGASTVRAWRAGTAVPRLSRARAVAEVLGEEAVDLLKAWALDDLSEGFANDLADTKRAGEVTRYSRFAPPLVGPRGGLGDPQGTSAPGPEIRLRVILSAEADGGRIVVGVDEDGQYWELRPLRNVQVGSRL